MGIGGPEGTRRPEHIRNIELIAQAAALVSLADEAQQLFDNHIEEVERFIREAIQSDNKNMRENAQVHRLVFNELQERIREAREVQEELGTLSEKERQDPSPEFLEGIQATWRVLNEALEHARHLMAPRTD